MRVLSTTLAGALAGALAGTLAATMTGGPASAVADYDACIAMVEADPAAAMREATGWVDAGGGAAARHCRALALIATGAEDGAIDELLAIAAEEPGLPPEARADMMVQAGELLIDQGDSVTARAVVGQALALAPGDPDVAGLSAAVRLADGDPAGALAEIDAALAAGAATPRLFLLRATAQRRMDRLVAARDDAVHATELAPDMASAWLERGRVAAGLGDRRDAREAFLRAIELDRGGRIAAAARNALQRMEAGITE